jgi:tripartite ATP-independent transporter DctM subunit
MISTVSDLAPASSGPRAFRLLLRALRFAMFALLMAITAVVLAGVVSRYVFNASFTWTEELASWIFGWMIFTGMALGHQKARHIRLSYLAESLTPGPRAAVETLTAAIVAFATIGLMVSAWDAASMIGGVSASLGWSNSHRFFAISLTSLLSLAMMLGVAWEDSERRRITIIGIALGIALHGLTAAIGYLPLEGVSPSLVMGIAFAVTLALGVPVAFSLLFAVTITNWAVDLLPPPALVHQMVVGSSKFILLAIPFFLTAGYLMNSGGITRRILAFADSLVGHMKGGLAQVNVVQSALIGGISGSSGADTASTTKVLVPEMVRRGYSAEFSCAVTAATAILPNIIPPSIAMLVFASIADASVARLFVAGVLPGLLLAFAMMLTVWLVSVRRGYEPAATRAPLSKVGRTFLDALPALALAGIILGGLRFGIVTATEASVVAVVWAFVLGKFLYRSFNWRSFYADMVESATDAALIGLLIAVSVPFAWILIAEQMPQQFVGWARGFTDTRAGLLLLVNLLMLIAGTFLDITASMLIIIPMFMPLMTSLGVDPVHFGIIVVVNLMLGGLTPPFGILIFISASIARIPASGVFRECLPFLVAAIASLALITYVPAISLSLWSWLE